MIKDPILEIDFEVLKEADIGVIEPNRDELDLRIREFWEWMHNTRKDRSFDEINRYWPCKYNRSAEIDLLTSKKDFKDYNYYDFINFLFNEAEILGGYHKQINRTPLSALLLCSMPEYMVLENLIEYKKNYGGLYKGWHKSVIPLG